MTDEEILQMDFYDLCGINALFLSDKEKISYWREIFENVKPNPKPDENTN